MKEKMVFAPASVLFLLFVFLKQFYLFPSGGTNRTGSGRWFFLCVFAVCDRD